MRNQKILLNITVIVFVLCCIITLAHAQISPQPIKKVFNVKPTGRLTLNSQLGTIDVKIGVRNQVNIIVTKAMRSDINMIVAGFTKLELDQLAREALTDFEVTFEQKGSNVLIQGKFKRGWEYWQRRLRQKTYLLLKLKIDFQVTVPRQYNVDLKTEFSGNIRTDNIGGELKAETGWGDIQLGNVVGAVNAKTGNSGNITLKDCQSKVEAITGWGDIQLGSVARAVNAKTGNSGNIRTGNVGGELKAETGWGNIQLGNIAGAVDAKTDNSGNIRTGNVGGELKAETGWGDIQLGNVVGAVNAKTGNSGNITLKGCQSKVEAITGWGDIQLGNVVGAVNAKTGNSGNITLKGCQSKVEAITGWGDIHTEMTKQFTHPWTLQTSNSGKIVVMLISNVAIDVDAHTGSGSVSSDFPVQGAKAKNRLKGTINGGGPLLKMRTSFGDIRLRRK